MKQDRKKVEPDNTAVRRALHVQIDSSPYIIEDEIGFKLIAPDDGWQQRPDMHPALVREVGFKEIEAVSMSDLAKRYFVDRTDNLIPASGEEFLVATT